MNLCPIRLPRGSIPPAKSVCQLLSTDGEDITVVAWQRKPSTDYVNRCRIHSGSGGSYQGVSLGARHPNHGLAFKLEDIYVEMDYSSDEDIIFDSFDNSVSPQGNIRNT